MTFDELCASVMTLTKRPDLVAKTQLAVRAATLKAHRVDFFYRDLFEVPIKFVTSDYIQTLPVKEVIPLYRKLKYIRKCDEHGNMGKLLEIISPTAIFDAYQTEKLDVCYGAGNVINIRSSTSLQYIVFGCYLNPDISVAGYSSWIAEETPFAIIYGAAAEIFKSIGQDEAVNRYEKAMTDELFTLRTNSITLGEM